MNIIALSKIKALDLPRVGHLGFVIKDIEAIQVVVHFTVSDLSHPRWAVYTRSTTSD